MTTRDQETIDLRRTERLTLCPAADGVGTQLPRANLDRWLTVRDACASWHNNSDPEKVIRDQFEFLDLVQRRIVTGLFLSYVDLMEDSRDRAEDLEGGHLVVPHPGANAVTQAHVTFTLAGDA